MDTWKNRRAKTPEEYIMRRVKFIDDNGCWISSGNSASWHSKGSEIHRMSYEVFRGKIPDGKIIRHKCDNRVCINPYHLETGTIKDNYHDFIERDSKRYLLNLKKAQEASPFKNADFIASRAGKNHRDAKKVACIDDGKIFETIREAAKFYSIFESGISAVCRGKRKTSGGLKFKYAKDENEELSDVQKIELEFALKQSMYPNM